MNDKQAGSRFQGVSPAVNVTKIHRDIININTTAIECLWIVRYI